MNDWHSIRFLLIGAVAAILVASYAASVIQTTFAFDDRHSNDKQDCKSTQGKGASGGQGGDRGTSRGGESGLAGTGGRGGRDGPENSNGGDGGNGGDSGNGGNGGAATGGNAGDGGRGGNAKTICILVDPDIVIPSIVPVSEVLSRPNWDNAEIAALAHMN
ncbi:MAG: hypothetical protein WBQ25_20825 [Nitrososphaeraceae archaeon]